MTQRIFIPELVLASSSSYRRQQLNSWNVPFISYPPEVNEEELKNKYSHLSPQDLCLKLAQAKAESLIHRFPQAMIIGSDQINLFQNQILHKAKNKTEAQEQLKILAGKTHSLMTSLHVIYCQKRFQWLEETEIKLKSLTFQEIEDYVNWDESWGSCGGYKFEKIGNTLIENIRGGDPCAIIGLPLMRLGNAVEELTGLKPFSLWKSS